MNAPAPAFALPAASPLLLPRRQRGLRVVPAGPCGRLPDAPPSGYDGISQVAAKGHAMPPNDWTTRHPELVHWLQHAEDELVGYAPLDDIPIPTAVFPERLLPFFAVITSPREQQEPSRHQWASMDCLYSQADIEALRTFFARVHGPQDPFLFHDCVCHFASERLLVRQLTTVAFRLEPVRIVSLTY